MPPNHFLLSERLVRNGEMLEITLSGSVSVPSWSLITPLLLRWAAALFEAEGGTVLISFAIFIVQRTTLALIYSSPFKLWAEDGNLHFLLGLFLWTSLL